MSVNRVILVGRLGGNAEVKHLPDGRTMAYFSVATSENWRDKGSGEKKEKTEWHKVVIFNDNLVTFVEQYCKKGDQVYVEGQLQTRKWKDQSGADRYSTEVVVKSFGGRITKLSWKDAAQPSGESEEPSPAAAAAPVARKSSADMDDEIPF